MQTDDEGSIALEGSRLDPLSWVSRYADYLYSYALTRINNEDQARDLVQETFLAALEKANKFEGKSSERTWLTAILKFKVIDVYRKNASGLNKHRDAVLPDDEFRAFFDPDNGHWNEGHYPLGFGIEEPDALENKEFQMVLQHCMKRLPYLWHAVFTMKHIDEETTETICRELKVSASNFWVIMHRTKISLRACLQKNWI